jgi:N-acetyl-alpha-D-glucosaminyl L-malate synthase BshA
MRIAIVCYPTYGGSGVVATELGKQLARRGHIIHFITYERPFKLDHYHENIYMHEVEIYDYPLFKFPPYSLSLASKIAQVAKCAGLDLVHVHYAIPHTISAYLARQMLMPYRLPVVTTLHGTDITLVGADKQFFDITRFSLEVSDGVTAVSDSLRRETREIFKVRREIVTIPNFVDPAEYTRRENPALRSRFAAADEKIIMHISNFRPVKRPVDVVKVFDGINASIPGRLLLVGDGPERAAVQQYAEEHGLAGRIYYLGKQERVAELLSLADLFLLPSEKESFGLVALEAMACGVPVVATSAGGIPEVVVDGENGCLARTGDVAGMVRHSLELLQDPERHRQYAASAVLRAHSLFNPERIVTLYENYYERCSEAGTDEKE